MKAIRVHGIKDVRFEEVDMPNVGPDDVLIRVRAGGLCGTDLEVYDGIMFYLTTGMTRTPFILGHEWSGEVVELGSNVSEFAVGDRVTGECSVGCRSCPNCLRGWYNQCQFRTETGLLNRDGGFAEYIAFPKQFLHKCNKMAFDEAAFIEPTGVALYATKLAQTCPDDYVAPRARVAMTGLFAGQKCSVDFDPLVINNVTILGSLGGPGIWDEAIDVHERGKVTASPLITHRLPLSEFVKGIEIMRNRTDNAIKVVLEP